MRHTRKQRQWITLIATIIAAIIGTSGGYLMGRALTLRLAEDRLERDANRVITHEDAFGKESRTLLAALNASPYPYCSDAELAYFRRLVYRAKYLSDAGRMQNGTVACSAMMSRADLPNVQYHADYSQPDGTSLFSDLPLFRDGNSRGALLQQGGSYVVYSPHLWESLGTTSSRFIYTLILSHGQQYNLHQSALRASGLPPAGAKIFTTEGEASLGGNLYATRCSVRYYKCASAYIPITEALDADRAYLIGFMVLGGLIGALSSLFCCLFYLHHRSMVQQLRRAITRDKLQMAYQPIVDLTSGRIVGAEALARWTNEEGFAIGPSVFTKVAEQHGFVCSITRLVMRHALGEMGAMLRSHPNFRLSINVTAVDLRDPKFMPMLERVLETASVPARSVVIEITESSTAKHEIAKETIRQLSQRGHSVHIDDFGTGYSSLSYLNELSIDTIKIDQSFTQAIGTEAVTVGILPQILAMAKALKLHVIVEGVETLEQAKYFAAAAQPILVQGWLYGHAVPAEAFLHLLAEDEEKAHSATATPALAMEVPVC
jgi:sensor c-di-GMP phosphodiesterase-like protein